MSLGDKIEKCLNENGIGLDEEGNLQDVNSLEFISGIIALEDAFDIEFPDEFLDFDRLHNKEQIEEIIKFLIENK